MMCCNSVFIIKAAKVRWKRSVAYGVSFITCVTGVRSKNETTKCLMGR